MLYRWCNVVTQFLSLSVLTAATPTIEPPSVTISNGAIIGTATPLPGQPNTHHVAHAFLGIPFAQNPPLRFAPPKPALPWTAPLQATKYKAACYQQFPGAATGVLQHIVKKIFGTYGEQAPQESEDCLYVNVFTPPNASPKHPKPVMLWIFGGNLQFGTASLDRYNGGPLAVNNDVIVVTFNYRVNIFGFSNSPELDAGKQNAGFLDQRLALQWVQQNIAAFGGNPKQVLLFGESAGGYSIKQLLANPPQPLPFAAAIMQSQQSGHMVKNNISWARVVNHFGCHERISPLRCMRQVPAKQLKLFIETNYVTFGPVQEDRTSTMDVRKSIASGKFANVPIIIGTNANEARAFEAFVGLEKSSMFLDFVGRWFRIDSTSHLGEKVIEILQRPGKERFKALDRFFTDLAFTCPSGALAQFLASKGYDVHRYYFSGVYPNMAIFGTHPEQGAYHTAEIPMIFGTSGANMTEPQTELSKLMQGIWSGMAKAPGSGPGWPDVGKKVVAELGNGTSKAPIQLKGVGAFDKDCKVLGPLAELAGLAW